MGSTVFAGVKSEFWEWLKSWAKEVHHVSGIIGIVLFIKLPAVETINKKAQSAFERIRTTVRGVHGAFGL